MNNNIDLNQNNKCVQLRSSKNVLIRQLAHRTHKYLRKADVKRLAEKKYQTNGLGITFEDVMQEFSVSKRKAQRTLKNLYTKKFLFTAQDLINQGIRLKTIKRENPQRYYLTEMKSKIIENRKNNVQIDTTGISILETQKIQYLQDQLIKLSKAMLHIHKLQIKTKIDKENYDLLNLPKIGKVKVHRERIGQVHGSPNVEYHIHTNGTIMIFITCSDNPFRLYEEEDISTIMVFLGRVEDRLRYLLADTRDEIIPSVKKWILKQCDVNKDIEIDGVTQLTLQDMHMPSFEKALRGYVKLINNKAYYRFEKPVTPNQPIPSALENLRTSTDLEKDFQFTDGYGNRKEL